MNPFHPRLDVYACKMPDKVRVVASGMLGTSEMVFPMSVSEFADRLSKWHEGALIQHAFDKSTPTQREFLLTGMSIGEQEDFFEREDDEY